nr:4-alpha-glucanotransferase [Rhizobium sp. Q54]
MSSKPETDTSNFDEIAALHGIPATYEDLQGQVREVPVSTRRRMLKALGVNELSSAGVSPPQMEIGENTRCYLPRFLEEERVWGISLQLYELRSSRNWGIGDFADLKVVCEVAGAAGADFVGLSPLHALFLAEPSRCSPYSPSNRKFLNPLYIAVDHLPGFDEAWVDRELLAGLRMSGTIDYEGVTTLKLSVLRRIWSRFREGDTRTDEQEDFAQFCIARGDELRKHALFDAIALELAARRTRAGGWPDWPEEYRTQDSEAVRCFERERRDEVDFHCWLQWVASKQLANAADHARASGLRIGLYFDFAVGEAPDGSSTWSRPDLVLPGLRVGAPPDMFSTSGQDWSLTALSPKALQAQDMVPYDELLDASMRYSGALRIDHAMGLWQLFLLPEGETPAVGGYLRYPFGEMVGTLAKVSHRRKTIVIGEDLGNVPTGFREVMEEAGILGYRVFYFEPIEDGIFDVSRVLGMSLACLSTHDLPPLIGWWRGDDILLAEEFALTDRAGAAVSMQERQERRSAFMRAVRDAGLVDDPVGSLSEPSVAISEEVFIALHRLLARTPSRMVAVRLADLAGEDRATNVPGTSDAYPNWQLKLRLPIEELAGSSLFTRIVDAVAFERPKRV